MLTSLSYDALTAQSRQVVRRAQETARLHGHALTDTDDLLLALVHDDNAIASRLLGDMGVDLDEIRFALCTRPGGRRQLSPATPPLSAAARDALEYFAPGPPRPPSACVEPGHLMFALLTDPDGTGAKVLRDAGVDLDKAKHCMLPALNRARVGRR
jgi:ATP-dependent Clp protease ATP-binding subunit ClpA